jgi:hypothetical protein
MGEVEAGGGVQIEGALLGCLTGVKDQRVVRLGYLCRHRLHFWIASVGQEIAAHVEHVAT